MTRVQVFIGAIACFITGAVGLLILYAMRHWPPQRAAMLAMACALHSMWACWREYQRRLFL